MATFKPRVSLDVLPQDAITLKGDQFYDLVEQLTSTDISRILKSQCINSINTFLLCKNVLESILLPTSMFDALRRDVCVRLDQNNNNMYVIHVGIIDQIDYLTELFRKKHFEEAKTVPGHRSTSSSTSTPTSTQSVLTVASASLSNSTLSGMNTVAQRSSTFDYRSNIVSSINKWVISEKKASGSSSLKLVEGNELHVGIVFFYRHDCNRVSMFNSSFLLKIDGQWIFSFESIQTLENLETMQCYDARYF